MTGGSRCLARHVDCRTTNESMSKVIGPSEQFQHGANQLLLGDRLVRVRRTAQRLVPLPNPALERLERIGGRDRLPPFGRVAYAPGQKVLGEQVTRHVNDSTLLRDSPSPASPSRGIVPCIEAGRLAGAIPLLTQSEHSCHNEYIRPIPPTGISRSQESANDKEMSANVRLIVGALHCSRGHLPTGNPSIRPPSPQTSKSPNDSPNLTIMSKMQQNAAPCNISSKIPALP